MEAQPASNNIFTHEPLPDPGRYIRLLEVLDDNYSKTIKVRCRLTTWPTDNKPPYHAISYTWGDPESNTVILMNDKSLNVRTNCEFALKQAYWYRRGQSYLYRTWRSRLYRENRPDWYTKSQYFWVDAICIDQMNLGEKSKQVAMMGSIYKNASHVLSCIGDHADDSLFFFQTLYGLSRLVVPVREMFRADPWGNDREFKGKNKGVSLKFRMIHRHSTTHRFILALARLARRPYFTRMWILQELQHARTITILCGQHILSKEDAIYLFDGVSEGLKRFEAGIYRNELASAPWEDQVNHRFGRRLVNHGMPHPIWHGDWIARLSSQCATTVVMLKQRHKNVRHHMFQLLHDVVSRLDCMDPRDKVYGLVSLIDWGELAPLEPDYTQTDLEVAINFIQAIIRFGDIQDLDEPLWKYVLVIIKMFDFNVESTAFSEALNMRRGYGEGDCVGAGTTPSHYSTLRLDRAVAWRLTPEDIDRNAAKLQGLQASPQWSTPGDSFYLPEWATANDWVIQADVSSKVTRRLWYSRNDPRNLSLPTYTPLLVMREGAKGCRNALVGYGFYSERDGFHRPSFRYERPVAVDIDLDIEDAIIFFWRIKELHEVRLGATDWALDYLNTGVCKQQTPGSSYVTSPLELPARQKRVEEPSKDSSPGGLTSQIGVELELAFASSDCKARRFVLFDTTERRGWLVNGQVVAVQLLCAYLKNIPLTEPFDFSKWDNFNQQDPMSAYQVFKKVENFTIPVTRVFDDVGGTPEHDKSLNGPVNIERRRVADVFNDIINVFNKMRYNPLFPGDPMRYIRSSSKRFSNRVTRGRNVLVRGWNFERIYRTKKAKEYTHCFDRDPGWLEIAEAVDAVFIFGSEFGDIIKRRDDLCCPYFRTIPKGQDFLAVDGAVIWNRVDRWSYGDEKNVCVARFDSFSAWERGADPLCHPSGQGEHLDTVDDRCFPIQRRVKMPLKYDDRKTDRRLLKKKRDRLYSAQDVLDMLYLGGANTTSDNIQIEEGEEPPLKLRVDMLIFGNKPGDNSLRQLAQANIPDIHSLEGSQSASEAPTTEPPTEAPSGHAPT